MLIQSAKTLYANYMGLAVFNRPGLAFLLASALMWWALTALPPSLQFEMLTALLLPLGSLALWRWAPGALRNVMQTALTPAKILTIAVATMAFAAAFQSIWRLVYLWLQRPTNMTSAENSWSGFATYVFVISLILYLLSTRRETDPPMPLLMWVVVLSSLVTLAIGFMIRLFYVL